MGIFSGKKKTYRDLSYARVIDDEYMPNVIGQAITTYVLDENNTASLADLMLEYGWSATNYKWNAARRWAEKAGRYSYGVPKTSILNESQFTGAESLDEVLQTLTGQANLNYVYSKFGSVNFRHAMWQLLVSNYSYNATLNTLDLLTSQLGTTVYLFDAKTYITSETKAQINAFSLEHWGFPPTGGATYERTTNYSRTDTKDGVSTTGGNYTRVYYTFQLTNGTRILVHQDKTVKTTVSTPDGNGGYTDQVTTNTTGSDTENIVWNGQTVPLNIESQRITVNSETSGTTTVGPTTVIETDSNTGVITRKDTTIVTTTRTQNITGSMVAYIDMGFGSYDFVPDGNIDTGTVLDDNDSGDYDPNAVLDPSGESTTSDGDYFQVLYSYLTGSTTHYGYFTYLYGSGSYPALDGDPSTTVTDFGLGFPRMYFRTDGNRLDDASYVDTANYKTSIKLGNKLGLDWLDAMEEVYKSVSALDKVRDIMLLQCIPANTTNQLELKYLHMYFTTLYGIRPAITVDDYESYTQVNDDVTKYTELPDTDYTGFNVKNGALLKMSDNQKDISNQFEAIGLATQTGSIGAVGTYTMGYKSGSKPGVYHMYVSSNSSETRYLKLDTTYHYYQYQVAANQYIEIRVFELDHSVMVGGGSVVKSGTDEYLMIPLDYAFRKEFGTHEGETLYARATHFLICTEYTVKTKWYQTGLFQAVTIVVAVAISWWTGGAGLTLIGAVTAVATAVGASIIFSILAKTVFSKLGGVFAIVATVVALAVAVYTGYLYFSATTGPFSITAQQMMQVSNVAFKAGQSAQEGALKKEIAKIASLEDEIKQKQEELETAQKELQNPGNDINDTIFLGAIQGYSYLGETPNEYFSRTLNTNIGVEALNLPELYLTQSLALPSDVSISNQIQQNGDRPFELNNDLNDSL